MWRVSNPASDFIHLITFSLLETKERERAKMCSVHIILGRDVVFIKRTGTDGHERGLSRSRVVQVRICYNMIYLGGRKRE
jgi:hypothetical protein